MFFWPHTHTCSARHGQVRCSFRLENHRTSLRIGFFLNGFANPHLVARSHAIHVQDPNLPQHARVTLTQRNTEAVVQWTTADSVGGTVQWGRKPGHYKHSADARDITYARKDMCGGVAKHVSHCCALVLICACTQRHNICWLSVAHRL